MAGPREPALCQLYRHTFVPRIQKIQRSSVYTTCMLKGRSYCARMRAAHIRAYSKRPFTEHTHIITKPQTFHQLAVCRVDKTDNNIGT